MQCDSESAKGTQHVSQQPEEQTWEKDRQTTNELITVNRKEEDQSEAAWNERPGGHQKEMLSTLALVMGEDNFRTNTYMCTRNASASKIVMNFSESSQIVLHNL